MRYFCGVRRSSSFKSMQLSPISFSLLNKISTASVTELVLSFSRARWEARFTNTICEIENCICDHSLNFFHLFVIVGQNAQIWFAGDAVRVILAYTCVKPLVRLYVCLRVGPFWVHSGSILGPFWVHSGSILGPFWVHFDYCLNIDASLGFRVSISI